MSKTYRVGCKGLDEFGRGKIVFNNRKFAVPYFLPGEKGEIALTYSAKETGARLVSVDTSSEERVDPKCPLYFECGGCQLLHMKYEAQLKFKQERIEALFTEEAAAGKILPIMPMEEPFHYRYKVYAAFSQDRRGNITAGIYEENSHRVVPVKDCRIQNEAANRIIATIVRLMKQTKTPPYNEDRKTGVMRHVYLRVAKKNGQVMVVLVTGSREFPAKKRFAELLQEKHPEIATIIWNINDRKTSMVLGEKESVLYGDGFLMDELCGYRFRISSKSFYQVNPVQTEKLYETAAAFAGLAPDKTVLDAYCGIGTISLLAAATAKEVVGVEVNADAVRDAKRNAADNHVSNVRFLAQDAGAYLSSLAAASPKDKKNGQKPQIVFLDPPRSGCEQQLLTALAKLSPEKIVYISCNPETQKRDTDYLKQKGYQVEKIQAVDCFCHTWHIECICLLKSKQSKIDA